MQRISETCNESFHGISSIHGHASKSAVKGDLFVSRKTTSIAQQAVSVAGPRLWNMILSTITNAQSFNIFKAKLKEHYLNMHTEGTRTVQQFIFTRLIYYLKVYLKVRHSEHTLVYFYSSSYYYLFVIHHDYLVYNMYLSF